MQLLCLHLSFTKEGKKEEEKSHSFDIENIFVSCKSQS